ncbi:hypothetical protein DICPUDRAFT_30483, partial [Dictyostelium purpureum]
KMEFENYRIQNIIDDITLLRIECDWVNDQTEESFKSIIEKGKSDFLYHELIWAIGKELSVYFNIEWPANEKVEKLGEFNSILESSINKLLKDSGFDKTEETYENRISMIEYLFLQLQTLQLDLFEKFDNTKEKEKEKEMDSEEMKDVEIVNQEDYIISEIQVLSDLFSIEFNNYDNLSNTLGLISDKIKDTLKLLPSDFISEPFFKRTSFNDQEKEEIETMSKTMYQDYKKRSIVLQKRLDVTVESLLWNERVADKLKEIKRNVNYFIQSLPSITHYTYFDLINVHRDLLQIKRTSQHSVSAATLNSVIIGKVPDRGGRTNDRKIPMPSFHKRVELSSSMDGHKHNKKYFKKK